MRIPEYIKDFFYFTKGERNGISFLLILIVLAIFLPFIFQNFKEEINTDYSEFEKEIKEFEKSLTTSKNTRYKNKLNKYIDTRYDTIDLFYFDPNNTSDESFKKLGLTNKQISTINNYINKGGRFYIKDDFRKIYGIRNYQYLKLKPFILLANKINYKKSGKAENIIEKEEPSDSLFYFDPNTTSYENWVLLGLKESQIKIIKNYINKGGVFYNNNDLKKIYGISEDEYKRLSPYIKIESNPSKIKVEKIVYVELNSSTINELIKINGIGNYLAKSIISYRKKLGGFIKKDQLLEIKNFHDNSFQKIKGQLTIDTKKVERININFSEVSDLVSHPYLNYKQSMAIVEYRTKNGSYKSVKELLDNKVLRKSTYNKIEPYLSI